MEEWRGMCGGTLLSRRAVFFLEVGENSSPIADIGPGWTRLIVCSAAESRPPHRSSYFE